MSGRTLRQLSSMLGLNHGEVRMDAGSGMRGKDPILADGTISSHSRCKPVFIIALDRRVL